MRSSILFVIGALALGCGGRQDDAQTTPAQTMSPSGAEGTAPPPMAGQEMQGQEQPQETQEQDMQSQGAQGQDMQGQGTRGTQDPGMMSQGTQGQGTQGQMPGQDMQGMHDGHGQAGMTGEHDMAASCPMEVPGTTARTRNVPGGVAIVFTTTSGDVADLQQRVAQMADMHNMHHTQGQTAAQGPQGAHGQQGTHGQQGAQTQQGTQGQQGTHGQQGAQTQQGTQGQQGAQAHAMIPAQARAENTARGARLVLIAQSAKDVKKVRQQIRQHAQQMASSGQCSMMDHQAGMETPAQRSNRQAAGQPPPPPR